MQNKSWMKKKWKNVLSNQLCPKITTICLKAFWARMRLANPNIKNCSIEQRTRRSGLTRQRKNMSMKETRTIALSNQKSNRISHQEQETTLVTTPRPRSPWVTEPSKKKSTGWRRHEWRKTESGSLQNEVKSCLMSWCSKSTQMLIWNLIRKIHPSDIPTAVQDPLLQVPKEITNKKKWELSIWIMCLSRNQRRHRWNRIHQQSPKARWAQDNASLYFSWMST